MTELPWWGAALLRRAGPGAVWARSARSGNEITFAAMRRETARQAEALSGYGIRPGSTVAVHGTPSFTYLWSLLALWSLGAQVTLLDPRTPAAGREDLLELCSPQFVVTLGETYGREDLFVDECEVLVRRRRGGRAARTGHCLAHFSSGTTGHPKAVGRTPASLLAELERLRTLPGMPRAGERVAVLEPVTQSFALIGGVLHALGEGATLVLPAARSSAAVVAAAAAGHVVLGSPAHIGMLAEAPVEVRLPSLRRAVSGGEELPSEVAGAFARRYAIAVGQAYGTTETGIVAADLLGTSGPHSIGTPVPGVRTRTVRGVLEIQVEQSPYLYDRSPGPDDERGRAAREGCAPRWSEGWLSTQDRVVRDPATGVLRLCGRTGAAVRTGVDPLEVETVLRAHRRVTDAVVLGADPLEVRVAAAADLGRAELTAWCRRFLGVAAVPERYDVVPELPRTPSGKVLRERTRRHGGGPRAQASADAVTAVDGPS